MAAPKQFTFTGRGPGDNVADEFDAVVGDVRYVAGGPDGPYITTANQAAGTAAYVQINADKTSKFVQCTFVGWFGGLPSTAMEVAAVRDSTAPQVKAFNWLANTSAGKPTLKPRGGGDVNLPGWTGDYQCLVDVPYILSVAVEFGTTSSNGKTKAKLATVDAPDTTLTEGQSTTLNTGVNMFDNLRIGKQAGGGTINFNIDSINVWDAAYTYLPPAADPTPPAEGWAELVWTGTGWR